MTVVHLTISYDVSSKELELAVLPAAAGARKDLLYTMLGLAHEALIVESVRQQLGLPAADAGRRIVTLDDLVGGR